MRTEQSPFSPAMYEFLEELREHNERRWFNANKDRYLAHVRDPMREFIVRLQEPLAAISPYINADPRPAGGSMFRIYRDTRFSKDKTPYKTHAACSFNHRRGTKVHSVGFYAHFEPGNNGLGGGIWRPPTAVANMIRTRIAEQPEEWLATMSEPEFKRLFPGGVYGEQLKRVPRDFDPDNPLAHDLRRKEFLVSAQLTSKEVTSSGLIERVSEVYAAMAPLVGFLAAAIGLEW